MHAEDVQQLRLSMLPALPWRPQHQHSVRTLTAVPNIAPHRACDVSAAFQKHHRGVGCCQSSVLQCRSLWLHSLSSEVANLVVQRSPVMDKSVNVLHLHVCSGSSRNGKGHHQILHGMTYAGGSGKNCMHCQGAVANILPGCTTYACIVIW
jgi:hypothetical protein